MTHTLNTRLGFGRTAEIFPWTAAPDGSARVLKLFHDWMPEDAIRREAAITRTLHAAGLPVPRVDDVITHGGRLGIVYERVAGDLLDRRLRRHPWRGRWVGRVMGDLHAQLHAVQVDDLPPLRDSLRSAIHRAPDALPDDYRARALAALDDLPDGAQVCHTDFHPENIMLTESGAVVIDWLTAARGHPLADVARTAYLIANGTSPDPLPAPLRLAAYVVRRVLLNAYLARYAALTGATRDDLRAWMLPIVAARFAEGIDEEIPAQLRILRALDAGQRIVF